MAVAVEMAMAVAYCSTNSAWAVINPSLPVVVVGDGVRRRQQDVIVGLCTSLSSTAISAVAVAAAMVALAMAMLWFANQKGNPPLLVVVVEGMSSDE